VSVSIDSGNGGAPASPAAEGIATTKVNIITKKAPKNRGLSFDMQGVHEDV
jgi:hypothetical protein